MVRNVSVDNICDLPIELLELIMGYISYDEIARIRSVCRLFDSSSQRLLNRGFVKVEKYHSLCFKRVKTQLPRRESERRSHPLARHCDVLSAIETRLSLLGMTYMKYVEMNLCCFIPGKVIDEIYRVLRFIQNNPNPPRVHELLQELRDISSMAMEYFEEKIAPSLKNKLSSSTSVMTAVVPLSSSMNSCHRSLPSSSGSTQLYSTTRMSSFGEQDLNNKSTNLVKQMQTSQNTIKKEFNEIKVKLKEFSTLKREITALKTKARDADKTSLEKDQTIAELKAELEDLKRRMTEYDKKSALKSIKDEQQIQKETKIAKRKSQRSQNTKSKRVCKQSTEIETEEQPMEVSTTRQTKTRQTRVKAIDCKQIIKTPPKTRNSNLRSKAKLNDSEKSTPKSVTKTRKRNIKPNVGKREKRVKSL